MTSPKRTSRKASPKRRSPVKKSRSRVAKKNHKCKYGRDRKSGLCRKKSGGNKGDLSRSRRDYKKSRSPPKKKKSRSPVKKSRRVRGPTKRHICKYGRKKSTGRCHKRAVAKKNRSRRATAPVRSRKRSQKRSRSRRRRSTGGQKKSR